MDAEPPEVVDVEAPEAARAVDAVAASLVPRVSLLHIYENWNSANCSSGGAKVIVEPHRHEGVFVGRGKEDLLLTKNLTPGESVYGEKRIQIPNAGAENATGANGEASSTEYRVWNPFRSKLAAGILGGMAGKRHFRREDRSEANGYRYLHEAWQQGALPWCCLRNQCFARC